MGPLDQFGIQRELITLEEKIIEIRSSFLGYSSGDETSEVHDLDVLRKKVRSLQVKMRKWFAPDP